MIGISIAWIIIGVTVFVSWQAFEKSWLFDKLLLNQYSVRHRKEYYRVISHVLIHADWTHLLFNMFTFYSFGTFMESVFTNEGLFLSFFPGYYYWGEKTGEALFLLLYLLGGIAATIPSILKHGNNFGYNAVGASGAVSAIMMAFMIMFPNFQVSFFMFIPMPAWVGALIFLGLEHYLSRTQRSSNIAHDAHIWGALFGILFVIFLNPEFLTHFISEVRESIGF